MFTIVSVLPLLVREVVDLIVRGADRWLFPPPTHVRATRFASGASRLVDLLQQAHVSTNAKIWSQVRLFFMSGYVLIVRVLVKSDFLHTFRSDFFSKKIDFLSTADVFLKILGETVLRQYAVRFFKATLASTMSCALRGAHKTIIIAIARRIMEPPSKSGEEENSQRSLQTIPRPSRANYSNTLACGLVMKWLVLALLVSAAFSVRGCGACHRRRYTCHHLWIYRYIFGLWSWLDEFITERLLQHLCNSTTAPTESSATFLLSCVTHQGNLKEQRI